MARKPRLEFEGAIYHIINRGNYREDVFGTKGAAGAFEKALFEAAEKCHWVIHAYVVMSNHFHLAVETPEGNLVSGMAWLQGTYANRRAIGLGPLLVDFGTKILPLLVRQVFFAHDNTVSCRDACPRTP